VSQENIEIVQVALRAHEAGDIEGMLGFIDPECELHSAIIGGAEGKVYRGHAGFRQWFAETQAAFMTLRTELSEFRDLGERVVGLGHIDAVGRESGLKLESPTGWVFALHDGKIVRAEGFLSTDEALAAAGAVDERG
jgi:ketosteroid isomerase-like protein